MIMRRLRSESTPLSHRSSWFQLAKMRLTSLRSRFSRRLSRRSRRTIKTRSLEFDEEQPAVPFERYLKTGSGREFARRHFRQRISG